jgi:hypothetical protein
MRWFRRPVKAGSHRVLVAFAGDDLDSVVLQAALRIARAEQATLVPAYLIVVPLTQSLDSPLVEPVGRALPILDAIESEARKSGVPVDSRMERERSLRDAIRRLWAVEHFDRIILPATPGAREGFDEHDLAWILTHAPTETLVLRPAPVAA